MRTLMLGIVLAGLVWLLSSQWLSSDEEFTHFRGVQIGMKQSQAKRILVEAGWSRLARGNRISRLKQQCGETYPAAFINSKHPGNTVLIHTDDQCNVTKIVRRYRELER